VTMRSIRKVFHRTTALASRLRQLALFMIISKSEVRNSPWSEKNSPGIGPGRPPGPPQTAPAGGKAIAARLAPALSLQANTEVVLSLFK
jgi:hypothetical protein